MKHLIISSTFNSLGYFVHTIPISLTEVSPLNTVCPPPIFGTGGSSRKSWSRKCGIVGRIRNRLQIICLKHFYLEMEIILTSWITDQKEEGLVVTTKMAMAKAKEIQCSIDPGILFKCS